jgi:hypothetical protein
VFCFMFLIPGRSKRFFSSPQCLGPTQHALQWVLGALTQGVKWQRREADHSPPSSAEVNNGGAIPSLFHMPSWHSA